MTSFNDVTSDSETQMLAAVTKGPVSVAIEVACRFGVGGRVRHLKPVVGHDAAFPFSPT